STPRISNSRYGRHPCRNSRVACTLYHENWLKRCQRSLLQIAHSDQIPTSESQQEKVVDAILASDFDLTHLANGLGPAKTFFDTLANLETSGVALVPGGSAIQCRAAGSVGVASDMWGNASSSTGLDKGLR